MSGYKLLPEDEWAWTKGSELVIKFSSQPVMTMPIPERRMLQDHLAVFFGIMQGETETAYIIDVDHGDTKVLGAVLRKNSIDFIGEKGKVNTR